MIDNEEKPSEYFSRNAASWLSDAYAQSGYNYPTPFHRLRIVKKMLASMPSVKTVVDVGCGGGQLAAAIAEDGLIVRGVDQCDEMLASANDFIAGKSADIQSRVSFQKSSIEEMGEAEFDAFTSMGVIGYLPKDDDLFNVAAKSLRSEGYCIVSFRNRLFNLFSLSYRTLAEIESGEFSRLYKEVCELYEQVDEATSNAFVQQLHAISGSLVAEGSTFRESTQLPSERKGQSYSSEFEARQTTPGEARSTAERCGFDLIDIQAVHPHLAVPGLNKILPPQVYNRLCDSLIPLEGSPLALLWSSVFIGVFKKQS